MAYTVMHRDELEPDLAALYPNPFVAIPGDEDEGAAKCFDTREQAEAYASA